MFVKISIRLDEVNTYKKIPCPIHPPLCIQNVDFAAVSRLKKKTRPFHTKNQMQSDYNMGIRWYEQLHPQYPKTDILSHAQPPSLVDMISGYHLAGLYGHVAHLDENVPAHRVLHPSRTRREGDTTAPNGYMLIIQIHNTVHYK